MKLKQSLVGAWALIALTISGSMTACSASSVAQDIVTWTPLIISTANTVSSVVQSLAPADAAIIGAATVGFDAAANLLDQQAAAYLKNPSATLLGQLQAQVTALSQNVNAALLKALQVGAADRQKVVSAIQALAVGVTAVLALVESISKGSAKAALQVSATKIAQIEPLLDTPADRQLVAAHYGVSDEEAGRLMARSAGLLTAQGF